MTQVAPTDETRCTVLTIGHSTHVLEAFIALLQRHRVTAVADVRSAPYSRFNPQFNRKSLAEVLDSEGIRYVFLGDALGGRSDDPACYEDGRIRYDRVATTKSFRSGLDRVVDGSGRYRIALMCAEKEPLDCHRTLLVARALDVHGVDVAHIHADGGLEPHQTAMDRLLDIHNLSREGDLSGTREELIDAAITHQAQRVAHTDDKLAPRPSEHDS